MLMMRFTIIDEFGGAIRKFETRAQANTFIRNKKSCSIVELSLIDVLGECLL